ncbi:MAG TPA: MtrB/PioB family outer membrane beta-barrel protein [Vicinamibacterales bacterium]|nr:MtrB/PioB family outer membrane beta-barrel protein [Vicinamibacterales bacterium]
MTMRVFTLTAAFLLVSRAGIAQSPPQTPAQPAPAPAPATTTPFGGTADVGGLFTTTGGDEARYERYRDARDGLFSNFTLKRTSDRYLFDASASHVGYRDQQYNARFFGSRLNAGFDWISVPLNYSYITRTPYTINGTTLTLDDAAQRAVQGPTNATNDGTAVGVPCAPGAPPASCSSAALAAQAKANRSIYESLATTFDLRQRRDTASFGLNYAAPRDIDIDARFTTAKRGGEQPWGASFAFNDAVELTQPLDQRTNDLTLGASWAGSKGMVRVGWDGSWFDNAHSSLTFDNPIRITDFSNNLVPPNGPYDPSGYSNGNGAAQGRQALAPDNMMHVVSIVGLYRLPRRTTFNGTLQLTSQTQDDTLIPWTINSVINTPLVFAAFPNLAQLPRPTAQAEAQGVNTLLNLTSRPTRRVNVTVRYRYNDRDVRTPPFDATEYVRFDAVPEEIEEGVSHQFDTSRHIFDANVSFTPNGWGTIRAGYGHEAVERHGRGFSDVGENVFRLSYDAYSNRYVTVRAALDVARRRGEGFVEAESGTDEDEIVGPGGTQPTLRYYDEADRNRTRGSLVFTVTPRGTLDFYFQLAAGKDEYLADDSAPVSRPGELFGLVESTVTSWNLGASYHPTEVVTVGANYGRDTYGSFQRSRNASPPPDPTWTDPSRDWTLDNDDKVNNFTLFMDVLRAVRNTDIRVSYDYTDSDNSFVHGGPRIASLASANQFIPLPTVENAWHRLMADVQYFLNARTGVGFGYYFEKLDVTDFNTIDTSGPVGFAAATGVPRLDWLGGLVTGYGNRPYDGHTVSLRVLYRF